MICDHCDSRPTAVLEGAYASLSLSDTGRLPRLVCPAGSPGETPSAPEAHTRQRPLAGGMPGGTETWGPRLISCPARQWLPVTRYLPTLRLH